MNTRGSSPALEEEYKREELCRDDEFFDAGGEEGVMDEENGDELFLEDTGIEIDETAEDVGEEIAAVDERVEAEEGCWEEEVSKETELEWQP